MSPVATWRLQEFTHKEHYITQRTFWQVAHGHATPSSLNLAEELLGCLCTTTKIVRHHAQAGTCGAMYDAHKSSNIR